MFDGAKDKLDPIGEKERYTLELTIPQNHSENTHLTIYDLFSGCKVNQTPVFQRYKEFLNSPFTYFGLDIHADEMDIVEEENRIIGVTQNLLTHPDISQEAESLDIFHVHKPLIYGSGSDTHANLDKQYDPAKLVAEAARVLKPKGKLVLSLDAYFLNSMFMDDSPHKNYENLLQAMADNFSLAHASFDQQSDYGQFLANYFPDISPDPQIAKDTFTIFCTVPLFLICEKE